MTALLPCPFCGEVPDELDPWTFQADEGGKWGAVVCCCRGPEVRTGYGSTETWCAAAAAEWNRRAGTEPPAGDEPEAGGAAAEGAP